MKRLFGETNDELLSFTRNLLFDLSLMIGKSDCKAFVSLIPSALQEPDLSKAAGAVYFAFMGWARVEPLEELNFQEDVLITFDHANSFEADSYIQSGMTPTPIPICFMNCGYASGWIAEAWETNVVTVEVLCRARGDKVCRFIAAHPNRILSRVHEYHKQHPELNVYTDQTIPGFFERRTSEEVTGPKSRTIGSQLSDLQAKHLALESERKKAMELLTNLFPEPIIEKLQNGEELIAQTHNNVTVLFTDIVNFLDISDSLEAEEVIHWLNDLFGLINKLTEKYKLEKIKSIGASYLVASGISNPRDDHLEAMLNFALDLVALSKELKDPNGNKVQMRIGLSTGPVSCGVIGHKKYWFDIWGDTVNVASRMQTLCEPGKIQCTETVRQEAGDHFSFVSRGCVPVKGKGMLEVFYCVDRKHDTVSHTAGQ
jgi:class 3 adenylate cyclase